MDKETLYIVIPAYNEEDNLETLVKVEAEEAPVYHALETSKHQPNSPKECPTHQFQGRH